jgi:hypothetical protein
VSGSRSLGLGLPLLMALGHAAVSVLIFGLAIHDPDRMGLLPVFMLGLDIPVSIGFNVLRNALHPDTSVTANLMVDAAVFTTLGSLWYYLLGWGIRRLRGARR